jgi:hypothetical protein
MAQQPSREFASTDPTTRTQDAVGKNPRYRGRRGERSLAQSVQATTQARKILRAPDRIRLATIADNSAASIDAFVRANVKRGTTLITDGHASYPGLTGYRHDPRIVGKMAGHIVLPLNGL